MYYVHQVQRVIYTIHPSPHQHIVSSSVLVDSNKIVPKGRIVKETESINFVCKTYHQASWTFEDGPLPPNVVVSSKFGIAIQNAETSNSGYYECKGTTSNGNAFYAKARLLVRSRLTILS